MPELGGDWRVDVRLLDRGNAILLGDLSAEFVLVS